MKPKIIKIIHCFSSTGEKRQAKLIEEICKLGPKGLEILINIWGSSYSISVKRWAVQGLGKYNNSKSKKIIKMALKHKAMSVRLHALRSVLEIGDRKFGSSIKSLINDNSGGIRMNLLDIAVKLKIVGYKNIIRAYLIDEKWYIRKRAQYYTDILK